MPLDVANSGLPAPQPNPSVQANAQSVDYSSSVLVEELAAPAGRSPRTITLQGPGQPFRGANWGGTNMIVTEWYPGNGDEGTQQVLGPTEAPSSWAGEWNRTRMGKNPSLATDDRGASITIVDPLTLATLLEEVMRGGARLRVTWAQASSSPSSRGKIVREGRAKSWDFKADRVQDIAWTIDWEWQSRGARSQTATNVRDGSLQASSARLNLAMADLASQLAAAPFIQSNQKVANSASTFTLGQLESFANAPTALANNLQRLALQVQTRVQQVANIASTVQGQPSQVVGAAVNTARNAVAAAQQYVDAQGQVSFETLSTKTQLGDLLRAFRYFAQAADKTSAAALAAQVVVDQLLAKAPTPSGAGKLGPQSARASAGDMIAVHVCRDGDTPARISARYYGSMDHGVDLLQANRLPWHQATFNKGQVLFIPKLKAQQKTS